VKQIEFSKPETEAIVTAIRAYFREEHDEDIGILPAEMLLRFFAEEIGGHFYNRGLYDAQALIAARMDDLADSILALERPSGSQRA